jgi:pimeloyl-ACP methyl ester carboxylesterase
MSDAGRAFQEAERALLGEYGITAQSRDVRLADPALGVRVLETGAGEPLLLVHGSGMSAPTWAPMLAQLEVLPGGHAPFLDDPRRCAEVVQAM